jgi:hypothetical protein
MGSGSLFFPEFSGPLSTAQAIDVRGRGAEPTTANGEWLGN